MAIWHVILRQFKKAPTPVIGVHYMAVYIAISESKVDKYHLDDEWERFPQYVNDYGHRLSLAIEERDTIKKDLGKLKAKKGLYIRKHWEEEGLVKIPTDPMAKDWVAQDSEVDKKEEELIKAEHKVNDLKADVGSLKDKKKSLEYLTELFFTGYFSLPKVSDKLHEKAIRKNREDASNKIKESMKRRRVAKEEDDPDE